MSNLWLILLFSYFDVSNLGYGIKPNDTTEIGKILIGDSEAHNKGIGRNAMKTLIDYCFKTYNLKQITLVVHEDNKPAYSIFRFYKDR